MPTGYTAGIKSGEIKTFEKFATSCARAFIMHMRDEPMDAEYTPAKVSEYYQSRLHDLEESLSELSKISDAELLKSHVNQLKDSIKRSKINIKNKISLKSKLTKILSEAERYVPPTPDHVEIKKFMIDQLTITIDYDCRIEYEEECIEECQKELERWKLKRASDIKRLREDRRREIVDDMNGYKESLNTCRGY